MGQSIHAACEIVITILESAAAPSPDLPSHLFPGSGTGSARFRVDDAVIPPRPQIAELLEQHFTDAYVTDYNEWTGTGRFVVVDGQAPEPGEVITLGARDVPPPPDDPPGPAPFSPLPIGDFYDLLDRHDWFCNWSDDWSVEKAGNENMKRLTAMAKQFGGDYQKLLDAFRAHHFSGEPWNTAQWDKPARPVDGCVLLPGPPASQPPAPQPEPMRQMAKSDPSAAHDLVLWEVTSALATYGNLLERAHFRDWSHRLLCWAKITQSRQTELELQSAEEHAKCVVNRSDAHRLAVRTVISRQPSQVRLADIYLALCQTD